MRINIGTTNNAKVEAVRETILTYDGFKDASIHSIKVESEVADQPLSLEETMQGAMNRARNAFHDCDYSIGLEAGLIEVPNSRSGYMNFNACVIFDGKNYFSGFSSGFEYPPEVTNRVVQGEAEIKHAMAEVGISHSHEIAKGQGNVGLLTNGRINRKTYVSQSIIMAMVHLDNPKYYGTTKH